jgi:hypothetical protein
LFKQSCASANLTEPEIAELRQESESGLGLSKALTSGASPFYASSGRRAKYMLIGRVTPERHFQHAALIK